MSRRFTRVETPPTVLRRLSNRKLLPLNCESTGRVVNPFIDIKKKLLLQHSLGFPLEKYNKLASNEFLLLQSISSFLVMLYNGRSHRCPMTDWYCMFDWKVQSRVYFYAHLRHLSPSSAVAPAGNLHKDSGASLPFALPFPALQNERCPGKRKTHFFCATWWRFSCENRVVTRRPKRS